MICAVNERNCDQFAAACGGGGYWAARLQTDWELFGGKPASGWQFYTAPGGALALRPGGGAVLCGRFDPEELGSFLGFLGVTSLTAESTQECPVGYRAGQTLTGYVRPERPLAMPRCAVPWQLEKQLAPRTMAGLMDGLGPEEQDNFYAECCVRRNHGQGLCWGAQVQGQTVCAVGVCALQKGTACMFAGQTLPRWRGQGIGGQLIVQQAEWLAAQGYTPRFVCRPERVRFYDRLGFIATETYKEYILEE